MHIKYSRWKIFKEMNTNKRMGDWKIYTPEVKLIILCKYKYHRVE